MCGIIGYIGEKPVAPILLNGLARLEYRGYDSAGIAVMNQSGIEIYKAKGRLSFLREKTDQARPQGFEGIGHTRWATHGEPSDLNSHPHSNAGGTIAVVHNGIIENYQEIKDELIAQGAVFSTQTDTESIVQLLDTYYKGDPLEAIKKTLARLRGSYALGIMFADRPGELYCSRKDSPLVAALAPDGSFIASDIPAILEYSRDVYLLDNGETALLTRKGIKIFNQDMQPVKKEVMHVDWDVKLAEKSGFEHFMLKEMHEEPVAVRDTLMPNIAEKDGLLEVQLYKTCLSAEYAQGIKRIHIVACGTAYHCGLVGKYFIEKLMRLPVNVELSSEFRYSDPILDKSDLVIVISQSGETMDTIAAMREAQNKGCKVLAICNVVGSTISREADFTAYTWAGPEIAVASTKAYVSQLIMTYVIALDIAFKRGALNKEKADAYLKELCRMPEKLEEILKGKEEIKRFAQAFRDQESVFYLGRRLDYYIAQEASLKLKEITYIHSEALAAGELKHGTLALIEDGTLVITLATQKALMEKTISNITECRVRGAKVLSITFNDEPALKKESDFVWTVPETLPEFAPVLAILPMQLFAYYVACAKGCDVDKPRNLAKSVTVE
ncbi:MAG: glutamine--fructose-6-phosphate transaminase (isomerizing) [Selenomonadales bacterium]|jgi:glutamine-fructose-6-phosphate transaminase (isomerizing)|nr:glutamine--fructose-6-phosphate transaminase (isomerizing) [Clostridiales bacterium]PWM01349.1 MAG: glutamine--fructose-6-phosphate transaminase (isomerizing) [Selenomonadales bacterium]